MSSARTIAVIDVGSNSVRLLVARELSSEAFEVIDEERFDARIGEGQAGGNLTPEALARGLTALRVMSQVARSYKPVALTVVGTEALRRAPNATEFVAAARDELGLDVRILSSREEAFAGFLGVVNSTTLYDAHLLDIGGGSLELMRIQNRSLIEAQSVPLGAIYARERYFRSDPPATRDLRNLRKAVRQQLEVSGTLPVLYGTGGAIRNLARIVRFRRKYPLRRIHGLAIQRQELRQVGLRSHEVGARTAAPGARAESQPRRYPSRSLRRH